MNTTGIKRFGVMCRSFFGDQEGDFELEIERISAVRGEESSNSYLGGQKDLSKNAKWIETSGQRRVLFHHDTEKGWKTGEAGRQASQNHFGARSKLAMATSIMFATAILLWTWAPGLLSRGTDWLIGCIRR
jgi:hypothetical protein